MKNNKSRSKFGGGAIIYLVCLLAVVLFYLGVPYSKLALAISETNSKINTLRTEINMLNPYANQVATLNEKSQQAEDEYAQNKELDEPVMFSNILYKCADSAGVALTNIAITENDQTELKSYASKSLNASITISANNNAQIESFIIKLEQNEGSAMFVQNINYAANEGDLVANATIIMYTVEK